jgi:hypothetical protein
MTNFDVYAKISQGLSSLDRKSRAKQHDKKALEFAKVWRLFRKEAPSSGVADFARLFDETVPHKFDDYWEHPRYREMLYYLMRAGAQPVFAPTGSRKAGAGTKGKSRRTGKK